MNVKSILKGTSNSSLHLPSFSAPVSAGFPSPADDLIDKKLDLNEALIAHPAATFFVRVQGESMKDAGILDDDLLVVDRSLTPKNGQVVVAVINGEFTVKKIKKDKNRLFLIPENKKFSPLEITEEMDFMIWGVVTYAIHSL
jgi:DNA polymerase V